MKGSFHGHAAAGATAELSATTRTGSAEFTFPADKAKTLLFRASNSEVGSSDAEISIDPAKRTVSGSVTSGNFCGNLASVGRRSYYTLHFVAEFDQPFKKQGTWTDTTVTPGSTHASGGGVDQANQRLDAFFKNPDGSWALTKAGELHAEMDNEPSINTPWLYNYTGRPYQTQETLRQAMNQLWNTTTGGIPGNDDLGAMSSWYVWTALGLYPDVPSRAELQVAAPLFPRAVIHRDGRSIRINAPGADAPYVQSLKVNGRTSTKPWLPESFVQYGGTLD